MNALKELSSAGYRWQVKSQDSSGKIVTSTVISESPIRETEAKEIVATRLGLKNNPKDLDREKNIDSSSKYPMRDEPTRRRIGARSKKLSTAGAGSEPVGALISVNYPTREESTHRRAASRSHGTFKIDDDLTFNNHHQSEKVTKNSKNNKSEKNKKSDKLRVSNFSVFEEKSRYGFYKNVNLELLFEKLDFLFPNILDRRDPVLQLENIVDEAFSKALHKPSKPNSFVNACVGNDLGRFEAILKSSRPSRSEVCEEHPSYLAHNCGGCKFEKLP